MSIPRIKDCYILLYRATPSYDHPETHRWTIYAVYYNQRGLERAMKKLQRENPPEEYQKFSIEVMPSNTINPITLHV